MCWDDTGIQQGTDGCVGTKEVYSRVQVGVLRRHIHAAGSRCVCAGTTLACSRVQVGVGTTLTCSRVQVGVGTTLACSRVQVCVCVCRDDTDMQHGSGGCVWTTQTHSRVQVDVLGRHRHTTGFRYVHLDDRVMQQNSGCCTC